MTKRELVARILAGPAIIETEAVVRWFRVSVPHDREQGRHILVALAPDFGYMVEDYDADHAFAYLGRGKIAHLTQGEANQIAAFIRCRVRTHRGRRHPGTPRQ